MSDSSRGGSLWPGKRGPIGPEYLVGTTVYRLDHVFEGHRMYNQELREGQWNSIHNRV